MNKYRLLEIVIAKLHLNILLRNTDKNQQR